MTITRFLSWLPRLTLPRSLKYILATEVLVIALTGSTCTGTVGTITEPVQVQTACTGLALAIPVIEQFTNLSAADQAILAQAETALQQCSAGNATAAIATVFQEIEQLLASHGTSLDKIRAQQRARAARAAQGYWLQPG